MAQATPQSSGQSESMEDILQSIKRIIEDDAGPQAKPAAAPDVLELTEVVKDDGSVAPIGPMPRAAATPVAAAPSEDVVKSIDAIFAEKKPEPAAERTPAPKAVDKPAPAPTPAPAAQVVPEVPQPAIPQPATTKPKAMEDGLVSEEAAQAAAAALKPIAESAQKDYSIPRVASPELRNGNTVEDLILESLRPMLKAWLDEHLPTIVQKIVEKEVKRIVTFHKD